MILVRLQTTLKHQLSHVQRWRHFFNVIVAMHVLIGVHAVSPVVGSSKAYGVEPDAESPHEFTPEEFDREIRPILANTCFHCHGPDEANRGAELRLDEEDAAKEYAIVPGDPEASEMISRITAEDPEERMPPPDQKQQLTSKQIELLKQWISSGAPWSRHWSFEPPKRSPLPKVNAKDWPLTEIDHFILHQLEKAGLEPSTPAVRTALLRRVTLDLTGLPPNLEEIDAFLADQSESAYERVVDRLLASTRYGEHMAQDWLAAARYADTNGYQNDATRTMWPWRDWVVRSLNENMPFDQFTIEQLAGDLLENPTKDQLIATGFHRNHALNGEGGRNPEESRVEYVIDRADTTGQVWLGLTVGCARCHDHKYDAVTQNEFYQLYAFFNNIDERGGIDAGSNAKPVLALPTEQEQAEIDSLRAEISKLELAITQLPETSHEEQLAWEVHALDWLNLSEQGKLWQPLQNVNLECEHDTQWKQLDDGSVLVTEMVNSSDAYVVTAQLPAGVYHALQLQALKHPQLVQGLFSRGVKGGFSVTGLEVQLDGESVKLVDAQANVGGQRGADGLLDKSKYTTWTVSNPKKAPEMPTWLARFEKPIEFAEPVTLTVRMRHESRTGDAPIGRFLLSVTDYPTPTLKPQLGFSSEVVTALKTQVEKRSVSDEEHLVRAHKSDLEIPFRREIASYKKKIEDKKKKHLHTMIMRDRAKPRTTYRLERGLWNNPDKSLKLHPDVPASLPALPEGAPKNRLSLARWLTHPDHPLMARVTVNRYWQHFFGIGLVKTSEDFGVQGDRPSHPQLIDWLATEFIQSGWDVKHIHKLIVMSAVYRQSSSATPELIQQDPYNRLLTRGPRFRLSAQALRDQALMLSGLLVEKLGGPGVKPYQPPNVWSDFSLGKIKYKRDSGEKLYRRSLYTFWRRPVGPTLFFDNAARNTCTVRPSLTNTPLHALTLLNDTTYIEAARVFAERVIHSGEALPADRIRLAFRMATAREPSKKESASLQQTLQDLFELFENDQEGAAALVDVGEHPRDKKLDAVELAAYTCLMNAILNLDEVVTKG